MNNERRHFIRNLSIASIALCIDPSDLFASNGINPDKEVLEIWEEVLVEMNPPIRQLTNFCISSGLSEADLKNQYVGLVNMLAVSVDAGFKDLPDDQKYQVLRDAQAKQNLSKQQVKELYKAALVTGTVALGAMYITRGKLAILLSSMGAVLKVPKWIKTTGKIVDGAVTIYKGGTMMKDALTNNTIFSAEVARSTVYGKFLNSDADRFKLELPDLKLDISSHKKKLPDVLDGDKITDPVASGLVNWIKKEVKNKNIFSNKADLEAFLEKYVEKIGEIQEQTLEKMFDAERQKNQQAQLKERDTAALCQSIHSAIGMAISSFASPKEAEILNTLIGAGFQFAMTGMTPIGWAAVGINIATTLFSKSPNHAFEEAVLKALQQIQKQLNFIIEQIDILQKNQVEILTQLNEILIKIDNLEDIVTTEFRDLSDKMDLVYNTILIAGKEYLENDYQSAENSLTDAYNNNRWDEFYRSIQKLRDIAQNQLDDNRITKYDTGSFKAEILKKQLLFEQHYKMNISLYDSIGLASALYNYNPANDKGSTDFKPVHPVEFNLITESITGWLIISELSDIEKTGIAKGLLKTADETNSNLKRIAEQKIIKDKASQYEKVAASLLSSIHDFMKDVEKDKTVNKKNLLRKFDLRSIHNVRLNDFVDETMKNINSHVHFLDNHNDHQLYNLAIDLKLFDKIETISNKDPQMARTSEKGFVNATPKKIDKYFPGFSPGDVNGYKNNKIVFSNVLLDYSRGLYISFEVLYTAQLRISKVIDGRTNERGCGHDGNNDCFNIRRKVTATQANFIYDNAWKVPVREQCTKKGHSIEDIVPGFDTISFNDFLQHLIRQSFWLLKYDLVAKAGKHIQETGFSNFDGIGLSLMTLSKLNNLITSDNPEPYVIDYSQELYIREDIVIALQDILQTDMEKEGKDLFHRILNSSMNDTSADKQNSIFYLKKTAAFSDKLKPESFVDLCMILLKEKVLNTIQSSIARTAVVEQHHAEPFIGQSASKIKWYLDTQI
jgi:hypothetical protein